MSFCVEQFTVLLMSADLGSAYKSISTDCSHELQVANRNNGADPRSAFGDHPLYRLAQLEFSDRGCHSDATGRKSPSRRQQVCPYRFGVGTCSPDKNKGFGV